MTHYMKLNSEPFEKIAAGKKTIELRLLDEKRKNVKPNDEIIFTHIECPYRSISVVVDSVITASSFESLFRHISLIDCGYEENEINGNNHLDMNRFYSEEKQNLFGVIGIKFSISKERALSDILIPFNVVESYLYNCIEKTHKQKPEVINWQNWFISINKEDLFPYAYKKAMDANTLESAISFFDDVIVSYIYDQTVEFQDKLCEESDYDSDEDVRQFLYRYYDRPVSVVEFFPLKTWWDSTRISIINHFCGGSAMYTNCHYQTVFDGYDDDGDCYEVL